MNIFRDKTAAKPSSSETLHIPLCLSCNRNKKSKHDSIVSTYISITEFRNIYPPIKNSAIQSNAPTESITQLPNEREWMVIFLFIQSNSMGVNCGLRINTLHIIPAWKGLFRGNETGSAILRSSLRFQARWRTQKPPHFTQMFTARFSACLRWKQTISLKKSMAEMRRLVLSETKAFPPTVRLWDRSVSVNLWIFRKDEAPWWAWTSVRKFVHYGNSSVNFFRLLKTVGMFQFSRRDAIKKLDDWWFYYKAWRINIHRKPSSLII